MITAKQDGGFLLTNPWGSLHPPRPVTAAELGQLGVKIQIGSF